MPTPGGIWSGGSGLRARILAVALVPSLSLMFVGLGAAAYTGYRGHQATTASGKYSSLNRASDGGAASTGLREFLQALREERRRSGEVLADPADPAASAGALRAQWEKSDQAIAAVRSITGSAVPLARVDALVTARPKVLTRQLSLVDAVESYSSVIVEVESRRSTSLSAAVADSRVVRQDEINKQLTDLTETLDVSDALSFSAFSAQGMTSDALQAYARATGDFLTLLTTLQQSLPPKEAAELNRLTGGPDGEVISVVQRSILRGSLARIPEGPGKVRQTATSTFRTAGQDPHLEGIRVRAVLPVPRGEWRAATGRIAAGFVALQRQHLGYAAGIAQDVGNQQLRNASLGSLALFVFAIVVMIVSLSVSRSLIGRLRRLRGDTIELSRVRLPDIVDRLREGEQVDVDRELPALDYGSDEIGQVAAAFGEAQRTAVTAAANEAETRAGLRKVFLDIAHRSQAIVYRQLKLLDKAERGQEDPDQLELLFQLDHLATRARRNAENLIILGGGQAGRKWRGPVPLRQLIRSAISEAEHYARVTVTTVPEVTVVGGAAADLIHLLAELVDNATAFSPPAAGVEVRGNLVGRGLVIEIEDQGLGIQLEQLERFNEMLHNPPDFQMMAMAIEPRLGLFVVARLAARRGIRVTLTPSQAYGGTKVIVLVPASLLIGDPRQAGTPELVAAPPAAGPGGGLPTLVPQPSRSIMSARRSSAAPEQPLRSCSPETGRAPSTVPDDRPQLPVRHRMTHMSPRLQQPPKERPTAETRAPMAVDAETARRRMSALQRGTMRGRATDPEEPR